MYVSLLWLTDKSVFNIEQKNVTKIQIFDLAFCLSCTFLIKKKSQTKCCKQIHLNYFTTVPVAVVYGCCWVVFYAFILKTKIVVVHITTDQNICRLNRMNNLTLPYCTWLCMNVRRRSIVLYNS